MNKYYRTLELHKILEMLAAEAVSEDCKSACLTVEPLSDFQAVRREMAKTDDAFSLASRFGTPKFTRIKNMAASLQRCQSGGVLSLRELLDIGNVLRQVRSLIDWHKQNEGVETSLSELFSLLSPNKYLEEKIFNAILSDEEVADAASPELATIRRKIASAGARIREQLDKMVRSPNVQKYLQDNLVTMRDGRYVVPVKVEYKNEVSGLVHDTSASGATLFVEPMGVVEANNEIRVLLVREKTEIERILAELSADCASAARPIADSYDVCIELELYFAKANLGARMRGCVPALSDEGVIRLKKARHPLIAPEQVVPIDVTLGETYSSLIVTGPNTGGKTVTLKTVGLLTAMAMCGLMVPAGDGSSLSVFDEVLADIGDEQSIEQSLSTFSSHMNKIIRILGVAGERSLVLLDELGSGTDPIEGAALAVSILEELRQKRCKLVASTHYQEIKVYALQTEGVENACCEFDVDTLKPTYRLLIGVPGKSNAFAIASRLGMPDSIIATARQRIDEGDKLFETTIEALEHARQEYEQQRDQVEQERQEAQHILNELRDKDRIFNENKDREFDKARLQALRIVESVRAQSQALMDELDELRRQKEQEGFAQRALSAKSRLRGQLDRMYDAANPVRERQNEDYQLPRPLRKGDTVLLVDIDKKGTLLSDPDASGNVYVLSGSIRTKVNVGKLRLASPDAPKKTSRRSVSTRGVQSRAQREIQLELDIRGQTVEEGLMEVDQFIDNAVLSGASLVTIIHGKGTGALRAAVQEHLKRHKSVRSFRLGVYGEGESGVTIAEIM